MTLADFIWATVPEEMMQMAKAAAPVISRVYGAAEKPDGVLYCPDTNTFYLQAGHQVEKWASLLGRYETGPYPTPPGWGERAWMPVKLAAGALRPLFSALQMVPNKFNSLFGGPTPIAASLAGGLLGAGLGYGAGWVGEKALGEDVLEPGKLRRLGLVAGGLLGMAPGAYLGTVGARLNSEDGKPPLAAAIEPNALLGKAGALREMNDSLPHQPHWDKLAEEATAGGLYMPSIPVDAFNRVIWDDPTTPMPLRAATTGLIESASQSRGGVQLISPWDIGRIAVGMGSGYASGMLVGRVLGSMAGLTPQGQSVLKQTGMWAGALANVLPRAFGG